MQLPSKDVTPEEATVRREQREMIWQFFRKLSTRQQGHEQLLHEGLTVVLQVRQVLTSEQRVKAARLREQLRALQGALHKPSE